jgi:PIN domain nuclease of toxin-antitoxin system
VVVLDTHIVIWLAEDPESLSVTATRAIESERESGMLAVSDITVLELARLISRGRVAVRTSMTVFLQSLEQNFTVLPITSAIAERAMSFSAQYPRDPVDRVVGATALAHGAKLITKDEAIRQSGEVDCIW